MIRIVQIDDWIYGLESRKYSPALHREAKATPGLKWRAEYKAWCGWPDAVAACVQRLEEKSIIVEGELPPRAASSSDTRTTVPKAARKYQMEGVRFLIENATTGALLADDMGLGKSSQALWTIGALERSALIVCPSFVRHVWVREAAKWLPKWPLTHLYGTKPKPDDEEELRVNAPTIFLIHYDIVHAWVEPVINIARPEIVVFDEIHALMSDKSRRSIACRTIARATLHRIGLSGTPMTSRPRDLWNVVDTLSEGRFGRPFDFFLAHANAHKTTITTRQGDRIVWDMTGASRLEELKTRLDYFMLRRTKSDVELELPQRTRQVVEVEIKRECRTPIGSALKSDRLLREALALAADGKLPKAVEMIINHVESGSKVVVFTHRKAIAELMATSLKANNIVAKVITGDVPQKRRVEIVDEQPTVLCATMDSTQVGIDLTFADIAVFVELDWVPSKLAQCEARLHRYGQKRNVLIQYVIALSTADEVIADAVVAKLDMFAKGIGKLDDGMRETLGGGAEISSVDQLKRLYEKLKSVKSVSP
jgi:SWI/SNF-related matrix-associated actin-dependent regulator of chromatin subfamily A-like protein 1